jgi:hypothetical protein
LVVGRAVLAAGVGYKTRAVPVVRENALLDSDKKLVRDTQ